MKKILKRAEGGFSLVELMISVAIGLVMVIFVSSLYIRSRTSYEVHDDNARLQQEGRIVMAMIGRNLTQAGYGSPAGTIEGPFLPTNLIVPGAGLPASVIKAGQGFNACDNGFTTPGDTSIHTCNGGSGVPAFETMYVVNPVVNTNTGAGVDCNGQTVPANGAGDRVVINRFYLATQSGETQSLFCAGNGGTTPQPLLGNVEDMRLTYGVAANAAHRPDSFVKTVAEVVTAETAADPPLRPLRPFRGVVTVAVCLQIASADTVTTTDQSYYDCSGTLRTASDRKIHTTLNGVFTLRNNSDTTLLRY